MRNFIATVLVLLNLCLESQLGAQTVDKPESKHPDPPNRPNIVLVMCDDLGWGDVGFNGGTKIQTPYLNALAQQSLRFRRFYAHAPVCSPTRGSCLTGRHPFRYGIYFANTGHLKPSEYTLPELLQEQGYSTGHFGKWHLGTLTKEIRDANRGGIPKHRPHYATPQGNGFDVCFSTESKVPTFDPMRKPVGDLGKTSAWDAIKDLTQSEPYGTHYWNEKGEIVRENLNGDNSRVIMDRALPFIEQACQRRQPFFAVVWLHTPHLPVVAGPRHQQMYANVSNVRHRNYFGCVTAMDEQIGRLRQKLADLDVIDDTMLCFCSDNGPEGSKSDPGSAGPFRGRKRSLYEGGIRVPGLIHWPRQIVAGRDSDFPAVTSDYLPTILEILDLQPHGGRPLDGVSLLPLIQGKQTRRQSPIGFQSGKRIALSANRFKLIGDRQLRNWELYDLIDDPGESNDIAGTHSETVAAMAKTLSNWKDSCEQSDQGQDYRE